MALSTTRTFAPRRAPEAPRPAMIWALAGVGLVAAGTTTALAVTNDQLVSPVAQAIGLNWTALPFVAAGLVAWVRRPENRFGRLMVAAGFAAWLSALHWADVALLSTVGQLADAVVPVLFVHAFLAYPTGYLTHRPERSLVTVSYAVTLGLQVTKMLLGDEPGNLLVVVAAPSIAETLEGIQVSSLALVCLAAVVLLAVRRSRARTRRRPVTLLIDAFALGLVMMAVLFAAGLSGWEALDQIRWATFAVLGLSPVAFLIGLLDARLARTGLGELLVELRANPVSDLREPLARALRDPSLTVAYWLPEFQTWADHDGRPTTPPDQVPDRGTAFISRDGETVAALLFDPQLAGERELLDAVTAAAGIALENDRLQVELRARLQELRDSRARMLEAGQKERQRLERNLHDGAQQRLVALSLELGLLEASLVADVTSSARLRRARDEIAVSLEELRDVARGIYPAVLTGHGLAVALESLAARAPVPLRLSVAPGPRLPQSVEAAAYYVVSESLTNIGKHAEASSASVEVLRDGGLVVVVVIDDGIGGADTDRGSGLRGLADRVEALGGRLQIWSPLAGGTRVRAELPCA